MRGSTKSPTSPRSRILATLLATTWQLAAGHLTTRHLVVAWLVVVLYAAFDEWTQIAGRPRLPAYGTGLADAIGAARAASLFAMVDD